MKNNIWKYNSKIIKVAVSIYVKKINYLNSHGVGLLSNTPTYIYEANMMGCLKKYLHHKSVYIKIKYYLLMIGEFSQDDTVVMINIIYTYLNSEDSE